MGEVNEVYNYLNSNGEVIAQKALQDKDGNFIIGTYQTIANKVDSWSATVSDNNYPSEKLVKTTLDTKQETLTSGTNIKTINNTSLLGSGNIDVQTVINADNKILSDNIDDTSGEHKFVTATEKAQITTNQTNITTISNSDVMQSGITSSKVATYDGYAVGKQNTLTVGDNITIDSNNKISATNTTYSAGDGVKLSGTTFSGPITSISVDSTGKILNITLNTSY